MSKNDTHFFNVFSVVLGILVTFAILMFALAHYVGKHEQYAQVLEEPMLQDSVQARIAAPVRVAVTGRMVGPPLFEAMEILGRDRSC